MASANAEAPVAGSCSYVCGGTPPALAITVACWTWLLDLGAPWRTPPALLAAADSLLCLPRTTHLWICKEKVAGHVSNRGRDLNIQVRKARRSPKKVNLKRSSLRLKSGKEKKKNANQEYFTWQSRPSREGNKPPLLKWKCPQNFLDMCFKLLPPHHLLKGSHSKGVKILGGHKIFFDGW